MFKLKKVAIASTVAAAVALLASGSFVTAQMGLWNGFPIIGGPAYCSSSNNVGNPSLVSGCVNNVAAGPALSTVLPTGMLPVDTRQSGATNQSGLIPLSSVVDYSNPRNLLGNGAFNGTQVNGTSAVTCATTSAPTTTALIADRWVCDVNVGSGVGTATVITASPAPPTGFTNSIKLVRGSSTKTQPVCAWSAIPTPQATQLQGQIVTLSAQVAALAGLAADNGNVANLVIIAGTGTDEGLNGSWTATPAITPAWTGITTVVNTPIVLTTTFARFSTTATIPATATEVGVGVCFTTTAVGAAATDGIAFTGNQLEVGSQPTPYEVKPKQTEVLDNEQFVYTVADTAGPTPVGLCTETTANTAAACYIQFAVPMYKAPTVTITNSGTGFAMPTTTGQTAVTSTCAVTVNATFTYTQSTNGMYIQCGSQSATTAAVGITLPLVTLAAGSATKINVWTGL